MIHIVDGQTDVILEDITLDHIISDSHKKSFEDTLETYEFITFGDKNYSQHLTKMNRVIIPDEDGTLRELVIQIVENYRDTEGQKKQVLSYASYLLLAKEKIIAPTTRNSQTASMIAGWALDDTEWTVGIVESDAVRSFTISNHTNPYAFLKTVANEFELELRFRVEHNGYQITARYVDLLERIGDFKGREVVFGRDLEEIRRIENNENIVTALVGLGPEKEDGTRLEVLVEDEDALQRWGRPDQNGNLKHLIEVYEPESDREDMSETELRQYTRTELNKRINSFITYECSLIDLEKMYGDNERLYFGDTLRIKDEKFNPPLYLEARIFETDRSIKDSEQKLVKLGDYKEFSEEDVKSIWKQFEQTVLKRLEKLVQVNIVSSAGNIFKNGEGSTTLEAKTFLNGAEVDVDGTRYEYRWHKFDKNGNYVPSFYQEGKSINISATSIDEKASYRVEIILNDEVLTIAEITVSNVYDGDEGPQGLPGPKGDTGQGVEDITTQYYVSISNTEPTGGSWVDSKPSYQEEKYLWVRNKITYKNPTLEEYTQAVLDDGWQAFKVANEAKQEAQNAMTSADGKNTVFRQATQPPTENRKIGDLWFETDEGNKMYVWTGEWTPTTLDYQALSVGKLSAITADLGNITAGHIQGVTLDLANGKVVVDSNGNAVFKGIIEGASGRFGEVTVNEGDITIKDQNSNTKALLTPLENLIEDPDFENVFMDDGTFDATYNTCSMINNQLGFGWRKVGNPLVSTMPVIAVTNPSALPIFNNKSIVVNYSNHVAQRFYAVGGLIPNTTYTLSAFFNRPYNRAGGIPRFVIGHFAYDGTLKTTVAARNFTAVKNDYTIERWALTFTIPNDFVGADYIEIRIMAASDNNNFVRVDGVQLVQNIYPSVYNPDIYKEDVSGLIDDQITIWIGTSYPSATATIIPTVPLSQCESGWLLKWQAYVPGTGTENHNFQYTFIPKCHSAMHNGTGLKVTLSRGTNLIAKYIYIYNDRIIGHDDNTLSPYNTIALTEVLAI